MYLATVVIVRPSFNNNNYDVSYLPVSNFNQPGCQVMTINGPSCPDKTGFG